jgi:hypothetical protein
MGWLVAFILFNVINGAMLSVHGFGVSTPEYWIGTVCVCGSYIAGRAYERSR